MKSRIVLIGFSATGKSTVGERLAQRLGWAFLDTDREIVRQTGKSIGEIFHGEGEERFRAYERRLLLDITKKPRVVIAAGGGAVLLERNRDLLLRTCYIVCLEARPDTLYRRLLQDAAAGTNPVAPILTQGDNPIGRIAYLKQFRQPYYAIADWTVHTDNLTPDDVVEEILHGWRFYEKVQQECARDGAAYKPRYPLGDARESDAPYRP